MNLSLRTRLTLWYSFVLLAVLVAAGIAVVWLHARLGIERIDAELADEIAAVSGMVREELDELDVEDELEDENETEAAVDVLQDLELPGKGVAVLSAAGELLADSVAGVERLAPDELPALARGEQTTSRRGLRIRHELQRSRAHQFRVVVWTSLADHEQEHLALRRVLWLGVPLSLLVASLGGWIVGRRGLKPLTDMARQAEGISAERPDGRLAPPTRRDELGALATSFNGLLDRLAGALKMQRQFMADASHQLRTPISIVRTSAEVTLSGAERSNDEYREALAVVATHARRLSDMIDRMFTLALADLDARPLELTDFYLDELVQECAKGAQLLAVERQLTIRANTAPDVPFRGDEGLLRQMIMNLVDNAVRHTPAGGAIELSLAARNGEVELAVANSGNGIAGKDRTRIFERFVRLETAESAGGGGLGLPIARWVAEAHGGTLDLDASVASGTRFVAILPVSPEVTNGGGASQRPS